MLMAMAENLSLTFGVVSLSFDCLDMMHIDQQ